MKQRRVGTLTMGICLIACSIFIILGIFDVADPVKILMLSPIVLVLLGVEILISAFRGENIKYDGLSVLICLILIFLSLTAAAVCPAAVKISKAYDIERTESLKAEDDIYELLKDDGYLSEVDCFTQENYSYYNPFSEREISEEDVRLIVKITIKKPFSSVDEFAACAETVLNKVSKANKRIKLISVFANNGYKINNISSEGDLKYTNILNAITTE